MPPVSSSHCKRTAFTFNTKYYKVQYMNVFSVIYMHLHPVNAGYTNSKGNPLPNTADCRLGTNFGQSLISHQDYDFRPMKSITNEYE